MKGKENRGSIIEHKGVVQAFNPGCVDVAIQVEGACVGCKVKGACGMGDLKEKTVRVATGMHEAYCVGEKVIVSVGSRMGFMAVFLSYIIPLILLMVSLPVMLSAGFEEWAAGLSVLAIMPLYFVILWLFRSRINRKINFNLRKLQ